MCFFFFFFSSRRRHTRSLCDWSSDVCSSDLEGLGTPEVESAREPDGIVDEAVEEGGPTFADCGVAEAAVLEGKVRRDMREVLGVACLVKQGAPVLRATHRLDDEYHAAWHLDR